MSIGICWHFLYQAPRFNPFPASHNYKSIKCLPIQIPHENSFYSYTNMSIFYSQVAEKKNGLHHSIVYWTGLKISICHQPNASQFCVWLVKVTYLAGNKSPMILPRKLTDSKNFSHFDKWVKVLNFDPCWTFTDSIPLHYGIIFKTIKHFLPLF